MSLEGVAWINYRSSWDQNVLEPYERRLQSPTVAHRTPNPAAILGGGRFEDLVDRCDFRDGWGVRMDGSVVPRPTTEGLSSGTREGDGDRGWGRVWVPCFRETWSGLSQIRLPAVLPVMRTLNRRV